MISFFEKMLPIGTRPFVCDQKRIWDEPLRPTVWGGVFPPFRPSGQDKKAYESELRKNNPKKILILGATPELRDIAAECGAEQVFVADFSLNMLEGMRRHARHPHKKEEWLLQDWLHLSVDPHSFDAIIGDLVVRQLPESLQGKFFMKVHECLSPSGVFITRVQYRDGGMSKISLDTLCGEIYDFYDSLDKRVAASALRSRLYQRWHTSFLDFIFLNNIRAKKDRELLEKKFGLVIDSKVFYGNKILTPFFQQKWWISRRDNLIAIATKKFHMEKEYCARDYIDSAHFPTLVLRPK